MADTPARETAPRNGEPTIPPELMRLGVKTLRVILPFSLILLVKVFFDHFFECVLVVSMSLFLLKISSDLQSVLSLKRKSGYMILFCLLVVTGLISAYYLLYLQFMGGFYQVVPKYYNSVTQYFEAPSIVSVLWCCWVVDTALQLCSLTFKLVLCLYIGSKYHFSRPGSLNNLCNFEKFRRFLHQRSNRHRSMSPAIPADVENNLNNFASMSPPLNAYVNAQFLSRTFPGLARRFNTASNSHDVEATPVIMNNPPAASSNNSSSIPSNTHALNVTAVEADAGSDESKNDELHSLEPPAIYLQRVRVCSFTDILFYLLRTMAPMPFWCAYFSIGFFGSFLPFAYSTVKLVDLAWKFRGFMEACEFYLGGKLEYGHYSTSHDPVDSDCPICFDTPSTPITLDCRHSFCEVCILEWLEKEKTCPVCRSAVAPVSTVLGALKEDLQTTANGVMLV